MQRRVFLRFQILPGSLAGLLLLAASANAASASEPALRLEYALSAHADRMLETTLEVRALIAAMPGPDLPADGAPSAPLSYASLLEETAARLDHLDQLITDIKRIVDAMPLAHAAAMAPPAPRNLAARATAKPASIPPSMPQSPIAVTQSRTFWLLVGGLIAAALGLYMRRLFMRRRPTRKEFAAAIDAPPLKDEALELAEIMSSMGLAEGAAQALVERIQANPRQALSHWLKLLDVYRRTGKQVEFERAVAEIRSSFNVRPGSWNDEERHADRHTSLDDYAHIAVQLKKLWPDKPACSEYLLSLLADNRDGRRTGFPLPVVEDIVLLLAVLRDAEQPG